MGYFVYEELPEEIESNYFTKIETIENLKEKLQINKNDLQTIIQKDIYESTKIEGNTLTAKEVTLYLQSNITIRGKSLRDYLQVSNYKNVLDVLGQWVKSDDTKLTEELILYIHKMITNNELSDKKSGHYRDDFVHIRTTSYIPPDSIEIEEDMQKLIDEYNSPLKPGYTMFEKICEFKRNFERIHPFFDGNGRTGRVLMNTLFLQNGYAYISIPYEERDRYFDSLENNTFHKYAAEKMLIQLKEIELEHNKTTCINTERIDKVDEYER